MGCIQALKTTQQLTVSLDQPGEHSIQLLPMSQIHMKTQQSRDFTRIITLLLSFLCVFSFLANGLIRNLARMKVTSSVFGDKDLSTSRFYGGLCMCGVALAANIIYMFSLQVIQALSQFAMSNVLDSIAPSPDNLILYFMMALCDLTVFIFFVIRYFIIYAVAVLCTIIAVLLVPEFSRDFAKKSIDHILRILLLQPVAIFFTCLGILTMKNLPSQLQPFGYIGLTIFVFLGMPLHADR